MKAEAKYPIDFTQPNKRFVLSLHHNASNSFVFVNATKLYQSKAKNSEIKSIYCVKAKFKTKFSVDFNPIDTKNTLDIHKY